LCHSLVPQQNISNPSSLLTYHKNIQLQNQLFLKLLVPFSDSISSRDPIETLSLKANALDKNRIDFAPWPQYNYKPAVSFAIAYGKDCILLKYYVREKGIRAVYSRSNEPVYKDSCVEFFMALENENSYYNFEFNCIGNCLLAYGDNRENRQFLSESDIKKIKHEAIIKTDNGALANEIRWELTLMIPFTVFSFHTITSLQNKDCKANFYKCGDELPQPHFLAWNDIKSEQPDFHLPEYFGELKFVE
jgi:hypothetical protein